MLTVLLTSAAVVEGGDTGGEKSMVSDSQQYIGARGVLSVAG